MFLQIFHLYQESNSSNTAIESEESMLFRMSIKLGVNNSKLAVEDEGYSREQKRSTRHPMETGFLSLSRIIKPPGQRMQHAGCPFLHRDVASPTSYCSPPFDPFSGRVLGQTIIGVAYEVTPLNQSFCCHLLCMVGFDQLASCCGRGWGLRRRSSHAPGLCREGWNPIYCYFLGGSSTREM